MTTNESNLIERMYTDVSKIDKMITNANASMIFPATLREELGLCPSPIDVISANEYTLRNYVEYMEANASVEVQTSKRVPHFKGLLKQFDDRGNEAYIEACCW